MPSFESIVIALLTPIFMALIACVWWQLQRQLAADRADSLARSQENMAKIEANEVAIALINVSIAKEYLNKGEVRQVFSDLIAPINGQLGVIQGMLQSMTGGPYIAPNRQG